MIFGSVCSGIEAASVAWHPLGWRTAFVADIDPFPCAALKHYYPDVPNHGDMNRFKEWPDASLDVLVGGTPCQSFSVAGLRKGLDDPRGNLTLVYLAIAAKYRPEWLVWENVPGVLSDDGGRTFGAFLGGLAKLGYGFAYRVLDAQFFRVAQQRRRVFVVASSRGWRSAGAVLFERESLSGNPAPRREARERIALPITSRVDCGGAHREAHGNNLIPELARSLRAQAQAQASHRLDSDTYVATPHAALSPALKARDSKGPSSDGDGDGDGAILVPMIAHSLRAEGFDASEDGTGRGTPLVPVAHVDVMPTLRAAAAAAAAADGPGHGARSGDSKDEYIVACREVASSLTRNYGKQPDNSDTALGPNIVGFTQNQRDEVRAVAVAVAGALAAEPGMKQQTYLHQAMRVRRLTPRECERLQGFEDDYTLIPYRGKPAADGPRYKALGNSMAVPVMSWIGQRIAMVNEIKEAA